MATPNRVYVLLNTDDNAIVGVYTQESAAQAERDRLIEDDYDGEDPETFEISGHQVES